MRSTSLGKLIEPIKCEQMPDFFLLVTLGMSYSNLMNVPIM